MTRTETLLQELRAEVAQLALRLQACERALADNGIAVKPGLPQVVEIDAGQPLTAEDGFYPVERNARGLSFRWTGPDAAFSFGVAIDRSVPRLVTLVCLNALEPEHFARLRCEADGAAVDCRYVSEPPLHRVLAELPARGGDGPTRLTFILHDVSSPRDHNPESTDQRLLGVAFHSLRVEAAPLPPLPPRLAPGSSSGDVD